MFVRASQTFDLSDQDFSEYERFPGKCKKVQNICH